MPNYPFSYHPQVQQSKMKISVKAEDPLMGPLRESKAP